MTKRFYNIHEQKERADLILGLLVRFHLKDFDVDGNYNGPDPITGLRERLWFAYAFIAEGSEEACRTGNRIIEANEYTHCHFAPKIATQILMKYDERLTEKARKWLYGYLEETIEESATDEMDFVGVNDNFPCMSTYITLIGGKLLSRPDLVAIGAKRLHQLKAMLTRRGFVSEYNSPTYTGIQLETLAEIANYVEDEELRDIALSCEERIWADQLARLYLPASQLAGPYSRAYTADSMGHTQHFAVYGLLGEQLPMNPLNTLFSGGDVEQGYLIHLNLAFLQVTVASMLNTTYHCPEELIHHALNKTYPYEVTGTAEFSSSSDEHAWESPQDLVLAEDMTEYPAGVGSNTTYMTEEYALGTSTHEFHNGVQTDSFHLLLRRDPCKEASLRNSRTVYTKYIVNERKPGQSNVYERMSITVPDYSLWDEGRKLAFQHQQTAMILYKPKRFGRLQVSSLKLSLILPCPFSEPDEIWLGDKQLKDLTGESLEPCPVIVKDGAVYMAFHPLLLTDHGRYAAVKVDRVNQFLMISFYNYEGEMRDFDPKTFVLTGNGFVVQVSSKQETESFEYFRAAALKVQIHDEFHSSPHSRRTVLRKTSFSSEEATLTCEYSPISEGIRYLEVNGRILANEKLSMTGYDVNRLPFM
ncbi:hypothetical protein [Paenibacillus aceris]|uniref:Uncharacterized protein n=1 Tax=Paenibacillus aceris TaxID=869555 RepID=A0ABS4I1W6_9BACL|nr:hypothetical protein [Paenibacillus aceris]MBP1964908.1 hypothetical protein [Paenibacillus aceris]NHW38154.1 hypothetical protein [Paenibacillus aceris]